MRIVLLKPGDEALLRAATRLLNEEDDAVAQSRATALLAEPTYVMVVALNDAGQIMGRIYGHVLHRHTQSDLLLYEVDVDALHQRKGAAHAMLEFLRALCRERGYGEMWVLTEENNAPARALYEGAGGKLEGSPACMYVFAAAP
jgi:GNAT superfamily N-acetyltransferase